MKITIDEDLCLGYSHSGSVCANAYGEFEMADADVETLVALIREKETTDINELGIEQSHPTIYDLLEKEIYKIYQIAGTAHFIREEIDDYFEYDDGVIDYCIQKYGFNPDEYVEVDEDYEEEEYEDEEEEYEAKLHSKFVSWMRRYASTLSDKDVVDFYFDTINSVVNFDAYDFELEIPRQIIDLAGVRKYVISNMAEIDGGVLWVNHNLSPKSVEGGDDDNFCKTINSVYLTDDEMESVVALMREAKTTDVYCMNLREIYPDIYRKLDESLANYFNDLDLGGLRVDYKVVLPKSIIDMVNM
jgi:hypothetical protein